MKSLGGVGKGGPPGAGGASAAVLTLLLALSPVGLPGQAEPPDGGVVGAALLMRQLDGVKRVLVVGAHPDDEDTSLLATLARGRGVRTAYLALTRGEGGQNLIGSELDEGLGLVRTGELLAARELDGAEQFFTRAFDFGYSRNAEETLSHWPREEILRDVVWVVRSFRPQVIVSIFSGTPRDGHGQHQVAGMMAREAFDVAGDPSRFPEQLRNGTRPWQPLKLYRLRFGRRFFGNQDVPEGATVAVETGRYDPLLGQSYFQLAMSSRSKHRSQDMGVPRLPGPRISGFELLESRVGPVDGEMEEGFFQGVDTSLVSLAEHVGPGTRSGLSEILRAYRSSLNRAQGELNALEPQRAVHHLAAMSRRLQNALELAAEGGAHEAAAVLKRRAELVARALLASASVNVDVRLEDDLLVPGQEARVDVEVWNGGDYAIGDAAVSLDLPAGWTARSVTPGDGDTLVHAVPPGTLQRWSFLVTVAPDAQVSQPYFLQQPMEGDLYRWPEDRSLWARPRNPPAVAGSVELTLDLPGGAGGGPSPVRVGTTRAGEYVGLEKSRGEFRKGVLVIPSASVTLEPREMAWPVELREARGVRVVVRNESERGTRGSVRLEAPEGWGIEPRAHPVHLGAPGDEEVLEFRIRPGPEVRAGRHVFRAVLGDDQGRELHRGFDLVDYDHIQRWTLFRPARLEVSAFPVKVTEGLRVGYVMGSGDAGFEAIRQLGVGAELLGPQELQGGDLSRFDVLVLGVRAYETRPDLTAANHRVLDFARAGGTVLVQYNKYEFPQGDYAPYPVDINRPHDRVTDPEAPVTLLEPDNPVLTWPNRIGAEDFKGWVQERGLYFLGEWDERYTPLLEMADPGQEPTRGALLVAPVGDGIYVYTGLAFFRQFPEGVPGAYRLFANLLSLDRKAWDARSRGGEGGS